MTQLPMLKGCPRCGGPVERHDTFFGLQPQIRCPCGIRFWATDDEIVAEWNASRDPEAAKLEMLVEERDKVIGIAADALDVADNIIAVNCGTDTPREWNQAMRKVAKARAALGAANTPEQQGDGG